MSVLADRERTERRRWARAGSPHDKLVGLMGVAFPAAIGVIAALMLFAPFLSRDELNFVLDKNDIAITPNRLSVSEAVYRGADEASQPFVVSAASVAQRSAAEPVVRLADMTARISLSSGPARLLAERGRYDIAAQRFLVDGPVKFAGGGSYRLATSNVDIDLADRSLQSRGPVSGSMALGRFSANRLYVDLEARQVILIGRARLHINQGALR